MDPLKLTRLTQCGTTVHYSITFYIIFCHIPAVLLCSLQSQYASLVNAATRSFPQHIVALCRLLSQKLSAAPQHRPTVLLNSLQWDVCLMPLITTQGLKRTDVLKSTT